MEADITPEQAATRTQMERILSQFSENQHVHAEDWQKIQGPIPRRLYHYTTVDGLIGIATSGSLWASDARFLNDSSELHYAAELIDEIIQQVFSEVQGKLSEILPGREGVANEFEYGSRPFVACFCEDQDLLSQWRGYGTGQAPVSMGFDLHILEGAGALPPRTFLRKVVYDQAAQRQAVRAVVETWVDTIRSLLAAPRGPLIEDILPYPGIWALQRALAEHHLCYKHPAFAEEREWRLIKLVDAREEFRLLEGRRTQELMVATRQRMQELGIGMPDHPTDWAAANAEGVAIGFRRSTLGLVPYVELPIRDPAGVFTGRLPLWHVVQGPSAHPELAMEAMRMFLESQGYGFHTEVDGSAIPLRP